MGKTNKKRKEFLDSLFKKFFNVTFIETILLFSFFLAMVINFIFILGTMSIFCFIDFNLLNLFLVSSVIFLWGIFLSNYTDEIYKWAKTQIKKEIK